MRCVERALCSGALLLAFCGVVRGETPALVHAQRYAMGTMFDVLVHHPSRAAAARAADAALAEVARLERVLSHYDPASDLSRLEEAARWRAVEVDADLYEVLRLAVEVSGRSDGRFDVTIAPLLGLWRDAAVEGRTPTAPEIARARACVGYEKIHLLPDARVRFASDCLQLDLGGIGKGYAVDRAVSVLRKAGISSALVNAGGSSIAAIGAPPGRKGWPVSIGGPSRTREVLLLDGRSLSTSQQSSEEGFGHIVDPGTGGPVAGATVVSVMAPTATLSDALSTALVMMPPAESQRFLSAFAGVSALWVSADGVVRAHGEPHLARAGVGR